MKGRGSGESESIERQRGHYQSTIYIQSKETGRFACISGLIAHGELSHR